MKTFFGSKNMNRPEITIPSGFGIKAGAVNLALSLMSSSIAQASVESSLQAVQSKLVGTLLPLAAICGLVIAGFSFVMGHANARQHLVYAIIGAIVGFGAESIIALVRGLVH